jgi:hypothetical protein
MLTAMPPPVAPDVRLTPVTAGAAAAEYVNRSALPVGDVPATVVTVTSTVAAACGGATAVSCVSLFTVNDVAAYAPKLTADAPVKPLPVTITTVPPAVVPDEVPSAVTAGAAGALYVNRSADPVEDVPLGVVTVMSTVPAVPAGATAVNAVSDSTVKLVAAVVPKLTADAPVKPLPVTVTVVPPAVLPEAGVTAVTAGPAATE